MKSDVSTFLFQAVPVGEVVVVVVAAADSVVVAVAVVVEAEWIRMAPWMALVDLTRGAAQVDLTWRTALAGLIKMAQEDLTKGMAIDNTELYSCEN